MTTRIIFVLLCLVSGAFAQTVAIKDQTAKTDPVAADLAPIHSTADDAGRSATLGNIIRKAHGLTGTGHTVIDGSNALSVVKDNLAASAAPAVSDDTSGGYSVGSVWLNTTTDLAYICMDASAGAAVWRKLTLIAGTDYVAASSVDSPGASGAILQSDGTKWARVTSLSGVSITGLTASKLAVSSAAGALSSSSASATYPMKRPRDWVIPNPVEVVYVPLFKARIAATVNEIHCLIDPANTGETLSVTFQECDSTGASCVDLDSAISCDNNGARDDGAISNATIDAGDWVRAVIGTASGTISTLTISMYVTETAD